MYVACKDIEERTSLASHLPQYDFISIGTASEIRIIGKMLETVQVFVLLEVREHESITIIRYLLKMYKRELN